MWFWLVYAARISSDELRGKPLDPVLATLRQTMLAAFLRAAFWVVPALAFQIVLSLASERAHGDVSPIVVAQFLVLIVLSSVAWLLRRRPMLAGPVLFLTVISVASLAVVRYGPLAGSGAYLIVGCVLGIALLGPRRGVAAAALAVAAYAAIGVAVVQGAIPVPPFALSNFSEATAWIRIGMGLTVAMGFVVAFFVVTQRAVERALARAAEERLRAMEATRERETALEALAASHRLESIAHLASGFAHDVRNMLSVVSANVRDMRQHPEDSGELATEVEAAVRSCIEASRDLLAFARPNPSLSCRPDLVLAGLRRLLAPVLPAGIELVIEATTSAPVPLEQGELSRALLNLVLNARDAMPDGGRLVLRARDLPEDEVAVEVEDSGLGMDEPTRARAFEPFFTTHAESAGTGLGLVMVRRSVERAHGRATIESAPGRGTCVRLVLPRSRAAEAARDHDAGERPASPDAAHD